MIDNCSWISCYLVQTQRQAITSLKENVYISWFCWYLGYSIYLSLSPSLYHPHFLTFTPPILSLGAINILPEETYTYYH